MLLDQGQDVRCDLPNILLFAEARTADVFKPIRMRPWRHPWVTEEDKAESEDAVDDEMI